MTRKMNTSTVGLCHGSEDEKGKAICDGPDPQPVRAAAPDGPAFDTVWCSECRDIARANGYQIQNQEADVLAFVPAEVDGWKFSFEYPGIWTWTNQDQMPNGHLAATPFWSDDNAVQVEWQTIDGDVFPMPDFPLVLTGDSEADARTYVDQIRPYFEQAAKTFR